MRKNKLSFRHSYQCFWLLILFSCQIFYFQNSVSAVIVDQGIFNHLTVQIGEDVQQPTQCEVFFGHLEVSGNYFYLTDTINCQVYLPILTETIFRVLKRSSLENVTHYVKCFLVSSKFILFEKKYSVSS